MSKISIGEEDLKSLMSVISEVDDPRVKGRTKHELSSILFLVLCGVLSGCQSVFEIWHLSVTREEWLKKYVPLPHGMPSHDTISRVLSILDASSLEKHLFEWVRKLLPQSIEQICIDGKAIKGTEKGFNNGKRPLTLVCAFAHGLELTVGQASAPSTGSAETKAAIDCLSGLNISQTVVTSDAGINSKAFLEKVLEGKGDYIVPVKLNSKLCFKEIATHICKNEEWTDNYEEKRHGRVESRRSRVLAVSTDMTKVIERFPNAKCVIEIHRNRATKDKRFVVVETGSDGKQTYNVNPNMDQIRQHETSTYYVSSRNLTPKQALKYVRNHWTIENNLHWQLDVAFGEDSFQVRIKQLSQNLSTLRKMALNLIKMGPNRKCSLAMTLRKASWDPTNLEKLLRLIKI